MEFWYKPKLTFKAALLYPLSRLYRRLAYRKYQKDLAQASKPNSLAAQIHTPVIVVGNITVGGTGKTPMVRFLFRYLHVMGFKVGVISRGYGGNYEGVHVVTSQDSAQVVGDEIMMQYAYCQRQGLDNIEFIVCKERVQAALKAQELGCNFIIADDGLQHYQLPRHLEIAVVGPQGLGNKLFIPAGPLREDAKRLRSVDYIVNNSNDPNYGSYKMEQQYLGFMPIKDLLTPVAAASNLSQVIMQWTDFLQQHCPADLVRWQEYLKRHPAFLENLVLRYQNATLEARQEYLQAEFNHPEEVLNSTTAGDIAQRTPSLASTISSADHANNNDDILAAHVVAANTANTDNTASAEINANSTNQVNSLHNNSGSSGGATKTSRTKDLSAVVAFSEDDEDPTLELEPATDYDRIIEKTSAPVTNTSLPLDEKNLDPDDPLLLSKIEEHVHLLSPEELARFSQSLGKKTSHATVGVEVAEHTPMFFNQQQESATVNTNTVTSDLTTTHTQTKIQTNNVATTQSTTQVNGSTAAQSTAQGNELATHNVNTATPELASKQPIHFATAEEFLEYIDQQLDPHTLSYKYLLAKAQALITQHHILVECMLATFPQVIALCAIGYPQGFKQTLESMGFKVVELFSFPDHYQFKQEDIDNIYAEHPEYKQYPLMVTEKDAIKMQELDLPALSFYIEREGYFAQHSRWLERLKNHLIEIYTNGVGNA
ncbi:tetraacyldisaccharide 4'-kinase [Psittacicella hinzii]|uniref:Tetraacyldisaccharide 4'-kinase n=1 Tax=Psittacicella hinzii TaxID=2028575 RepID=A0A3A1YN85_9GAMM|nr:tetraacyldisaccharide 4'-kinase [Psittacicella hinzii]RIY38440.1 tetraacyldisaccharide 4'-kinase [Psittacicella hinzii]